MAARTSPATAALSTGAYETTFQGDDGSLWTQTMAMRGAADLELPMQAAASPAISASATGGYAVLYQGSDGALTSYHPAIRATASTLQATSSSRHPRQATTTPRVGLCGRGTRVRPGPAHWPGPQRWSSGESMPGQPGVPNRVARQAFSVVTANLVPLEY
jgi:hypothetical protein